MKTTLESIAAMGAVIHINSTSTGLGASLPSITLTTTIRQPDAKSDVIMQLRSRSRSKYDGELYRECIRQTAPARYLVAWLGQDVVWSSSWDTRSSPLSFDSPAIPAARGMQQAGLQY